MLAALTFLGWVHIATTSASPMAFVLLDDAPEAQAARSSWLKRMADDQVLSDDALRVVAEELGIPLADLYGTVTFYHHFSREAGGLEAPRVCTGPICRSIRAIPRSWDLDCGIQYRLP